MGTFFSIFGIAVNALTANKLRSSLTLLGIIFGVTSVMTIISALEGMMGSMKEQLDRMGPSTFMVSKLMTAFSDEEFLEKIKRQPIRLENFDGLVEGCDLCEKLSPRTFDQASVKYGTRTLRRIGVMGGTSNFVDIVDFEVGLGRFHSPEDDLYRRNVVFIGDQIREEFFEGVEPLGKTIKVGAHKFTVIGVAKKQGSMFGQSRDNFVIVPLSTFNRQFGIPRRFGLNLVVKAVSVERLEDAMDQVRMILRSQRAVPYDEADDFDMMTAESALDMLNQFTLMFRMVLMGVSAISLVIGGIVVMNIMMVAVSERTREIGIRKAIGAKRKHILWQFLFESVLVTFSGGIVGIVLGYMAAEALVNLMDMQISPSAIAIIAGLSISGGIGLIFGIYPAMKAARLDPIKALSYE